MNPPTVYYAAQGEVLIFEVVDEIFKCDDSNGSCSSCGAYYYDMQGASNF